MAHLITARFGTLRNVFEFSAGRIFFLCSALVLLLVYPALGLAGSASPSSSTQVPLLWQSGADGSAVYWLMDGPNAKTAVGQVDGASSTMGLRGWKLVSTGDLNGDGKPDFLWQSKADGSVIYWLMNGPDQKLSMGQISGTGSGSGFSGWNLVGTADLNGDGSPDFFWQSETDGSAVYWLMNGISKIFTGKISGSWLPGGITQWRLAALADIDGDGNIDLLWQNRVDGTVIYYLMNGVQPIASGYLPGAGPADGGLGLAGWRLIAATDLDGDHRVDLLWQSLSDGSVVYWLMNGLNMISKAQLPGAGSQDGLAGWRLVASAKSRIDEPQTSNAAMLDFLTQDICTDFLGNAVPGDPALCPKHRDIRLNEPMKYLRMDNGLGKLRQVELSLPYLLQDGRPQFLTLKNIGHDESPIAEGIRDFDLPMRNLDGNPIFPQSFDLIEARGKYVSFIGTADGGQPPVRFRRKICDDTGVCSCTQDDTWVLFPTELSVGQSGHMVTALSDAHSATCSTAFNQAYTEWQYLPDPLLFMGGKSMMTIMTSHFSVPDVAKANPANVSMERNFFTREFGHTRWERWETPEACNALHPSLCTPSNLNPDTSYWICNGPTDQQILGQHMIRVMCRDNSFYVPQADAFSSRSVWLDPVAGSKSTNLLRSGDFSQDQSGSLSTGLSSFWQASVLQPIGSYYAVKTDNAFNHSLQLGCLSCGSGQITTVYQDVPIPAWVTGFQTIYWGALVGLTEGLESGAITLQVVGNDGSILASPSVNFALISGHQSVQSQMSFDFSSKPVSRIRFLIQTNGNHSIGTDEAYLNIY